MSNAPLTQKEKAFYKEEGKKLRPFIQQIKGWRAQVIELLPEYDTHVGYQRMSHVLLGNSTDTTLLEAMKKVLKENNIEVPKD